MPLHTAQGVRLSAHLLPNSDNPSTTVTAHRGSGDQLFQATSGDFSWPPAETSVGHQWILSHGHGQWYRETDKRHENYWSNHYLPHILVMQNEARDKQVWARLDRTTIESTGVGIRVFVPESQTLIRDAAEVWTAHLNFGHARSLVGWKLGKGAVRRVGVLTQMQCTEFQKLASYR